jgi:uncharacterized RDD family membrane protein YckC
LAWSAAATIRNDPSQVHALVLSDFLDKQGSTYMITFILVVCYLLILVPERKGRTWGQMQFGLHVFNDQGSSDISVKAFWLRLLGQAVAILSLGKLPRQSAASSDAKTMADVLSGTTLMANPQNQRSIGRGFIGLTLIGSLIMMGFQGIEYTWLMRVRYEKPHVRALSPEEIRQIQNQKAAREAALERMALQRLDTACRQGDRSACETLKDLEPVK